MNMKIPHGNPTNALDEQLHAVAMQETQQQIATACSMVATAAAVYFADNNGLFGFDTEAAFKGALKVNSELRAIVDREGSALMKANYQRVSLLSAKPNVIV